jgi:hypothetical protein
VDGHVLYDATPDANAGICVSVGRDANGVPEFLNADPCPLSEQVDIPIETASLADGRHELQVSIVDAAGVATTATSTITTANRTTVSSLLSSPLVSSPGAEPTYAIVLAKGTAALGKSIRRSYADSAVSLTGQLRDPAGTPAPNVNVSLVAHDGNEASGALVVLDQTVTNTAGEWTLHAPRGPSRKLQILYGAITAGRTQDAVAIRETVRPSLSLRVQTPGGGRIVFSGRLAINPIGTPRPLVTIETKAGDEWEAVGHAVRATANGSYRYVYRSSPLTLGRRFAFQAQTPGTSLWQSGISPTREAVIH